MLDAIDPDHPSGEPAGAVAAIRARDLVKDYVAKGAPPKRALLGIDLEVPQGSIFGLLGPNGAGKSTFINILAGLVIKTAGKVDIWGFDIDRNPRQSRAAIGVVTQELAIDPFFTPREALEFQAGMYGVPPVDRRTAEILDLVGLSEQADHYARALSGGMRRRLMVAKALVHNPPVLVLDEPTAGVDVEIRRQLWDHVRELNAAGTTIVLTTHYLEEAQALCDRIAIIDKGEVVANAPTAELIGRIDRKQIVITPARPGARLPALPDGMGGEIDEQGRIVVSYQPSRVSFEELLARLDAAGIEIADLITREPILEDIFLQVTGLGRETGEDGGGAAPAPAPAGAGEDVR
jgi:ABC-2 type transport system ATP-binding protein